MGLRPDRAVIVYSNLIRQTYKKRPLSWAVLKQARAGLPTMITGKTRLNTAYFWIQVLI